MNHSKFSSHYKSLSTTKLIELATDPDGLVREALPFLLQELEQRGEQKHAELVKEFLALDDASLDAHSKRVKDGALEKLEDNASFEVAKAFLRDKGVSTYDILTEDQDENLPGSLPPETITITEEIEVIKADPTDQYNFSSSYLPKFITKKEIAVYRESSCMTLLRKEPAGKFLPYEREIIRGGYELLKLREANGEVAYVQNEENEITLCDQCMVRERTVNFLLISHNDYDLFLSSFEQSEIQTVEGQAPTVGVDPSSGFVKARVVNPYKVTVAKKTSILTKLVFNTEVNGKAKIGQLEQDASFYITEPALKQNLPIKIRTADGREGFLLDSTTPYKNIEPFFVDVINFISYLLVAVLFVGIIVVVASETGYIVILGLVAIILFYLVRYLVGVPLYLLARAIGKRL